MTAITDISIQCQYTVGDRDSIRKDHENCKMSSCECSCHRAEKQSSGT